MRAELGLSPPERRIGQTAHDFVAALGAPDAILARQKRGGVADRRLALSPAHRRGRWRDRDTPRRGARRAISRPRAQARPPRADRAAPPSGAEAAAGAAAERLSVTRIETLRRDPYAIYAERILELAPLPPIGAEVGPREIGDDWHDALEAYARRRRGRATRPKSARACWRSRRRFRAAARRPAFRALALAAHRRKAIDLFCEFDAARRRGRRIWLEAEGRFIPLADGSRSRSPPAPTASNCGRDGGAAVIDYKTGAAPGVKEVKVGFAPQLTLEAAMLKRGGFAGAGPSRRPRAIYFKLGGADGGKEERDQVQGRRLRRSGREAFRRAAEAAREQFADMSTPYLSRPLPKFAGRGTKTTTIWPASTNVGDRRPVPNAGDAA